MEITQIPSHFLSGSLPPSRSYWDVESFRWCIWTDSLVSNAELLPHQSSHVVPSWSRGGEKKMSLRELEVGNTPDFVAFGLLLLFFPYREKSVPHGQLQSREALDGTIASKCISPVLQGDKNTCTLTSKCAICVDFVVGLAHSCVFTLSRSYAVAPALSHSAYRRARSRVYHSPLSVSRSFSLTLFLIPLLLLSSSVKLATSVGSALFYLTNEILKSWGRALWQADSRECVFMCVGVNLSLCVCSVLLCSSAVHVTFSLRYIKQLRNNYFKALESHVWPAD